MNHIADSYRKFEDKDCYLLSKINNQKCWGQVEKFWVETGYDAWSVYSCRGHRHVDDGEPYIDEATGKDS